MRETAPNIIFTAEDSPATQTTLPGLERRHKARRRVKQEASHSFPAVTQWQQGWKTGSSEAEATWAPAVYSHTCRAFLPPPCHFTPVSGPNEHLNSTCSEVRTSRVMKYRKPLLGNNSLLAHLSCRCFFTNVAKSGFPTYLDSSSLPYRPYYCVESWKGKMTEKKEQY